jgi:hypothetical protein
MGKNDPGIGSAALNSMHPEWHFPQGWLHWSHRHVDTKGLLKHAFFFQALHL